MSELDVIGARIRTLREARGLTQAELGHGVNASRELVNMWERGARDLKTGTIIDLARFFNVSCDYILTGVEANHLDIHESLGLDEDVIQLLEEENKRRTETTLFTMVDILNGLFTPKVKARRALSEIYQYLYFDFTHPHIFGGLDQTRSPEERFEAFVSFDLVAPNKVGRGLFPSLFTGTIFEEAYLANISYELRICKEEREKHAQKDNT